MSLWMLYSFLGGFLLAWLLRAQVVVRLKKTIKRQSGLLESERLVKETLRKESALAFRLKEEVEQELGQQLSRAGEIMKEMDRDILLLQKSNEDNEKMFSEAQPELYDLKLRLIEANNTISRMKAELRQLRATEKAATL